MTVNSTTLKSGPYNTDGVTKSFSATFQYIEDSDIVVTLLNTTTGATTVGVLNTDFTVVDNVAPIIGGTVTIANNGFGGIASATGIIAAGYTVTLNPSIPQLQQESYPNAGLFPSLAVEQALDRLTLIAQELQLGSNQSMKTPVTDSASITTTIPNATLRKAGGSGSYLFFSGVDGSPGVSSGVASVAVSTTMTPVVQATTLGAAMQILDYGNIPSLAPVFTDTNVLEQSTANVNSYAQEITQNTNSGAAASTDIVVANNLANATTYYGNLGMNSSGFAGSGSFNKANAVYLSATSGDLVVGTTTGNVIHFVYGGSTTDTAFIDGTGLNVITQSAANNTTLAASTAMVQAAIAGSSKQLHEVFLTSGTSWTSPSNITSLTVFEITGIGGGGGGTSYCGAGAGQMFINLSTGLSPNTAYTYAIGAAGNTSGTNGGNTTFNDGTATYTAHGGVGSTSGTIGTAGGSGTTGATFTVNGAAGANGASSPSLYGTGGSTLYGSGGNGQNLSQGYGAGGGGGNAGVPGVIVIRWVA